VIDTPYWLQLPMVAVAGWLASSEAGHTGLERLRDVVRFIRFHRMLERVRLTGHA
jgi:hypothetical protein